MVSRDSELEHCSLLLVKCLIPTVFPSTADLLNMIEYKFISWADQNPLRVCQISLKFSCSTAHNSEEETLGTLRN